MNAEDEHGFWNEWDSEYDDEPRHPPGRRHGHRGRRDRGEQWRRHFYNHMGSHPEDHWLFSGRRFRPWHRGRADFNPFVANLMSMGGGLLPVLVLKLIEEEPRYGNELMRLIRRKTAGQWVANPGAIYPLLTQLEEEGLISGEWEDERKRTLRKYELTPAGKSELQRLTEIIRPKLVEAIDVLHDLEQDLAAT
jgi:DNA-binding PadR family transcriptional regulator